MADKGNTVTLLAGGDMGLKEFSDTYGDAMLPLLRQADLRMTQCEKVYSERPYVVPDPKAPRGPRGRRPIPLHPRLASIFEKTGIDIVSMAGNHHLDWGPEAMMDTVQLFRGMGKHVIGLGKNIAEARTPAIVERNGVRIAFLGYCSVLPEDFEAREDKPGAAPMRAHTYYQRGGDPHEEYQPGTPMRIYTVPWEEDLRALQADIRQAKLKADIVVMSIHWGVHHIPKHIATYQPTVAHAAIDAGADLILGHHPHCLKGIEIYKGKVCFYSIGNFMTSGGGHEEHDYWGFYYYHVDPECVPPLGKFANPREARMTMVAKAEFSKKGVERVSFYPAFISPQAEPAVLAPSDPKFKEIFHYMEWLCELFPCTLRVDGNEVVIDSSN